MINEIWWVRRPGATCLIKARIVQKTNKTITVREECTCSRNEVYKRTDLELIERWRPDK